MPAIADSAHFGGFQLAINTLVLSFLDDNHTIDLY